MNSIVIVSKDILMTDYLPTYGNGYWKTPNIDELAKKGTVFDRHYSAAASTVMSFMGMVTGKYPYQFDRKVYKHEKEYVGHTIFDTIIEHGMQPHIVWSDNYMLDTKPYANCWKNVTFHTRDINQPVGPHLPDEIPLEVDEAKTRRTMDKIYEAINEVPVDNAFLWIHLPHVILGRTCYGGDIDLFDEIIGYIRKRYGDDNIYITADHGNMNGKKGKYAYGFHVYEPVMHIPFITPKIENMDHVEWPTSNTQLEEIIFKKHVSKPEYVLCESTYYLQPNRRTALVCGDYKLIRNKLTNTEEMYDVIYDKTEERNLLNKIDFDKERNKKFVQKEVYFYPKVDRIDEEYKHLKELMDSVWRMGTPKEERKARRKYWLIKNVLPKINKINIFKKKQPKKVVRKS